MTKHFNSRLFPIVTILVIALALSMAGCKKKAPKEAPPPPPPPKVEEVTPAAPPPPDTTGNAERAMKAAMDADRGRIATVYFDFDRSDIRADQRGVVSANADIFRKWTQWQVTVEGNCDERGTAEYNLALGERRASAGKQALVAAGVDAARISTVSYGKERPMDPGHSEASWAKNRRDDFRVK
jgi:peptidoglycan-associated lipoprotein